MLAIHLSRSNDMRFIPGLIVNLVAESGGVNNGQRDTGAFLIELQL